MERRISALQLDDDHLEEDIGTTSPYQPLHSASSQASTTTVSSLAPSVSLNRVDSGHSSNSSYGGTPMKYLDSLNTFPSTSSTTSLNGIASRQRSALGVVNSPSGSTSSLNLPKPVRPSMQLARSQTLPRRSGDRRVRKGPTNDLNLDGTVVQKLQRWIMGIAIVEFDIDEGPIISGVYPSLETLPAEEENMFVFLPYPQAQSDVTSAELSLPSRILYSLTKDHRDTRFALEISPLEPYQASDLPLVMAISMGLTRPTHSTPISGPILFTSLHTGSSLPITRTSNARIRVSQHIRMQRSDPTPGTTVELGFLGSVLHVEIPHSIDAQQLAETSSFNEKYNPRYHILATSAPFHPPPLLLFEACLTNLWSIWECLVLCEPILIFGSSPAQTSQAVWWLRDLLRPIPLAGDMRPYFTMQDGDHPLMVNKLPPKPGLILGVTNPFFEKSCAHWPHVLSLGRNTPTPAAGNSPALGATTGPPPGWRTKTHKRYISKDRALLKQLETACRGTDRDRNSRPCCFTRFAKTLLLKDYPTNHTTSKIPQQFDTHTSRSEECSRARLNKHAPAQAIQQCQLPRFAEGSWEHSSVQVDQSAYRVLREMASVTGIRDLAGATGEHR
ncbi:FAM116B protein [Coprinopsis cinerea okayama7|uniref:FAM116B protein n=1 Tax=Coprinopsis cinerea (strain Okayama-7 / 130 / ATCC MYA-4618 / FGSC 9003) TaxID=240176 RepID=A8NUX8_COPC7|nr:FAM116B protein [Coprinopsis cinerea okayama7\|eukprot:XP_001836558.2 FAM116B protein [Coprinopsis cinerea okayama7\